MIRSQKYLPGLFILGCITIAISIISLGWTEAWKILQITTMHPPFADMRTVSGSIHTIAQGLDPQLTNPGDPWGRPMNYPSIWIPIAKVFQLNIELNYIAFISSIVFINLVSYFFLLRKYPSYWMLMAIFSGSSLLAIERGNNDLLIFCLLYLACLIPIFFSAAIIIFATVLKIYPIFSIGALYKNKIILIITGAIAITLIWSNAPEIEKIRSGTPVSAYLSYGSPSISEAINQKMHIYISPLFISISLVGAALLTSLLIKNINKLKKSKIESREEYRFFLTGAIIYIGTFIMSSNWDYRLIFLILCLPYINLMENKKLEICTPLFILLASNQMILIKFIGPVGMGICILSKCAVFVVLTSILIQNSIDLLKDRGINVAYFKK